MICQQICQIDSSPRTEGAITFRLGSATKTPFHHPTLGARRVGEAQNTLISLLPEKELEGSRADLHKQRRILLSLIQAIESRRTHSYRTRACGIALTPVRYQCYYCYYCGESGVEGYQQRSSGRHHSHPLTMSPVKFRRKRMALASALAYTLAASWHPPPLRQATTAPIPDRFKQFPSPREVVNLPPLPPRLSTRCPSAPDTHCDASRVPFSPLPHRTLTPHKTPQS